MGRGEILNLLDRTMKAMCIRDIINNLDPEKSSIRIGNVSNNVRILIRQDRVVVVSKRPIVVRIKK